MVDMNQVIRYLKKNTDLSETVHAMSETTFKGTRSKADGSTQEVTVEVLDAGARARSLRYAVSVYSDDGKRINGNEAATLEEALSIAHVHWSKLG